MEVTLIPGIAAVSGTLCKTKNARVIFTTRKASSTNPNKVRMYVRSAESYKRTTPPSENESRARGLFARRQSYVQQLLASGAYHSKAEAWKLIIHYSLFPMSLQFSARFYNPGHRLKSISGRFGSFIFRTHTSGLITAFYKPKKSTNVESLSVHSRSVFESLSVQLREISDMLGLKITSITTNLPTHETHNS